MGRKDTLKKSIIAVASISLIFIMVSYGTAIPYSNSKPINNKIEKKNQINSNELDEEIIRIMDENHIMGLSTMIVREGRIVFSGNFGYRNLEKNLLVNNDTLFVLASISKTITATAIMQLYEKNIINLDEPINKYLPFQVYHPDYPETNITIRMLMTHTSGIIDSSKIGKYYGFMGWIRPLGEFLEGYLTPEGFCYSVDNFGEKPGLHEMYSNVAVSILGYIVEVFYDIDFYEYCKNHIFEPLGMYNTSFYYYDINKNDLVYGYSWNEDLEDFNKHGIKFYSFYPSSNCMSTTSELMRFLSTYMSDGSFAGVKILEKNTIDLMLNENSDSNFGLIWYKTEHDGRVIWGHSGGMQGITTVINFNPENNIGVIILMNSNADFWELNSLFFGFAETLQMDNNPPLKPSTPNGNITGISGIEYNYSVTAKDPDRDMIFFMWDWGDGNYSDWLGPFFSEDVCTLSYSWINEGDYSIKVKVKDVFDVESEWSDPLTVTMPKSISEFNPWIFRLIQRFPILKSLL